MPRLDDSTEALLESGERRAKRVWEDFTEFALRDNVLEVAVGLMYAFPPTLLQCLLQESLLMLTAPQLSSSIHNRSNILRFRHPPAAHRPPALSKQKPR